MSVNNFKAIFTLVIFLVAEILVSFPVFIPIPRNLFRRPRSSQKDVRKPGSPEPEKEGEEGAPPAVKIPLNYVTAPVAAVLILLAAGCIHGEQVRAGIVGSDGVEPLNVMALFTCLAYMVLSVDRAGMLRFLAFWVASRSGTSGIRLYIAIYTFFFCLGAVVGNDPVVLSGVPFLAYFTHETKINPPTAWIFGQFVNANIASAVLVSSNLTNLVLSGAFSISYFVYTAKIILPVLAAIILTLPVLLLIFRDPKYIPRKMAPIKLSPRSVLVDPIGGIISSTVLLLTLATLVATSTLHPQLYQVAVPPAVIVLARDIVYDLRNHQRRKREMRDARTNGAVSAMGEATPAPEKEKAPDSIPIPEKERAMDYTPTLVEENKDEQRKDKPDVERNSSPRPAQAERESQHGKIEAAEADATREARAESVDPRSNVFERTFPTVMAILKIMPFSLVLFSFSMFILVQGLAVNGWVDVWAGWWGTWAERTGPVGTVFGMGLISCVLCNIFGTNIGATILLARVLQVWIQSSSPAPSLRLQDGAIYTLALGSNFGAFTFTFPASLAGLLWRKLLLTKGIKVKVGQFAKLNFVPCAVAMGVSCAVLVAEVYIIHKE